MGLSFLNGAFLGALSLVSIPIIIHLLQRRRFKVVQWGAMEFLRLSQRNRSRRLMIEQILLLILRCLVILLVVLAVCRPIVRFGNAKVFNQRGQVHAIIILDNSYSMGYRMPGAGTDRVWDRSLKRTLELVNKGLRQGDAVSVVLASDPPRALIRKPSLDLKNAAALIQRTTLTDAGTNFGKAARLALEIAGESSFVNREVYLVGDSQAAGWEGKGHDPVAWEGLSKMARVMLLPTREGDASNVAVEWVQTARGVATVGTAARIQARIVNRGKQAARNLLVTLEIDGEPQGSVQRVDVEPGQGTLVSFNHLFDKPGVRGCTVKVADDRLPADDRAYLAVRVRQNVRVLVVNGKPNPGNPQKDAGFFLQLALSPPIGPGGEPTALEPRMVTASSGLGGANVRDYDVVALSDVASLGEGDRRLLAEFVQNGGGLMLFLGSRVNAGLYNRDLLDTNPSLLPARIGAVTNEKASLDPATLDHPALQRFRSAQDVDVATALFNRYYRLTPKEGEKSVRVIARFTNGAPALVERSFGLGKVVMVASTADLEWNDLPARPFFLPMLHQMVAYLASGTDGTRNGLVGETLVKPIPLGEASRKTVVSQPNGARTQVRPLVDERGAVVTLENPRSAGFYRLAVDGGTQDLFAVNRDATESDLRVLGEAALRRLLPFEGWGWVGPNEDLLGAVNRSRQGVELWRHFLFAALGLMILETMLAQLFGRRA